MLINADIFFKPSVNFVLNISAIRVNAVHSCCCQRNSSPNNKINFIDEAKV